LEEFFTAAQRLGASRRPTAGSGLNPESGNHHPAIFRVHVNAGLSGSAAPKRPTGKRNCAIPEGLSHNKKEVPMLYALLAYHVEADVASWTAEEDAAVMTDLHRVRDRLNQKGHLGVIDGPFAETKEQLLGFYILDCATEEAAIEAARDLRRVNPSAVYEIRPLALYLPGVAFPRTEAAAGEPAGGI
jgi:hypothetical protein